MGTGGGNGQFLLADVWKSSSTVNSAKLLWAPHVDHRSCVQARQAGSQRSSGSGLGLGLSSGGHVEPGHQAGLGATFWTGPSRAGLISSIWNRSSAPLVIVSTVAIALLLLLPLLLLLTLLVLASWCRWRAAEHSEGVEVS